MDALNQLVDALRCLPGIGPKSAQRMVYHLLKNQRQRGLHLATCLQQAMKTIKHCSRCNNYTDKELCALCNNSSRDDSLLCVVENPSDVIAIEQSSAFNGRYFILMGKISPLDGLGPTDIGLPRLYDLVVNHNIKEVILALGSSVEGQTTVYFINELLNDLSVPVSQLAHGIPSGGELEFLDGTTIGSALRNRAIVNK
jgi:recombination protein RecR